MLCPDFRHLSGTSPTKTAYRQKDSNPTCQVHPRKKQPLKLAIILGVDEFESLRLRFDKEGLAKWLVLFVLPWIDWIKGIEQVLASVVGYVQVGTSRTVWNGEKRR